jgi:DNA-binding transcriptional ArsR family regulator
VAARDVSGRKLPTIEVDFGLAYEFLMSLIVFTGGKEDFDHEVGSEWYENFRTKAGPDLLATIKLFDSECNHFWKHLLGLAYDSEPPRDVPTFIAQVAATEPLELRLHLIGYYQRKFRRSMPLDVIVQAAEGDPEAQRQYLKTSFSEEGDWQELLHYLFTSDPEETKNRILDILQRWYERAFRDYEPQLLPILQRDAEAKRAMKQTMSFERFIETATNGIVYVPEPGHRRVLLIPSYVMRPWNELSEYQDIKIFCYPVADENVTEDGNTPPTRLVRLYKALADERRLRILKMLMTKSYTLQEFSDEFGVAKTTMHHHLGLLRTAGLVRSQSNDKLYSLRHNTLSEVSELLDTYLKGKS